MANRWALFGTLGWILSSSLLLAAEPAAKDTKGSAAAPAAGAVSTTHQSGNGSEPARELEAIYYKTRETLGRGVTQATLSNGMTVIVQENHASPIATVRSFVKNTGSAFEGKYLGAGLSHLVEHLVAGGSTTRRTEDEIQQIVDSLGGRSNAYTSNDVTAYHLDCPASKVNTAIEIIADSMQFAAFKEDEYAREMQVVTRELEMGETQRPRVAYQAMKDLVYQVSPMRVPIIGYLPVLQQISRDDVIAFYKDRYVPQNMVFVVVGDVKTDAVLDAVLENFKTFHRTAEREVSLPAEPDQVTPRVGVVQMEGDSVNLSVAWPTVPLQHPDLFALDVVSFILANGDSSRLGRRLKIDEPLATSVSGSSFTPGFVKGWFDVSVQTETESLEKVRQIIDEEIKRLRDEPVGADELAKAIRQKSADHVFGQATIESQAESLGRGAMDTGDPLFDEKYLAGIKTVTAEQIQDAARRYLQPSRQNTSIIEPIGASRDVVAEASTEPLTSPIVAETLDNGMTILVKRNASAPLVTVQAFVKGGVVADTSKNSGLSELTVNMLERGTEKYTGQQIADYFDGIGGSLSLNGGRNSDYLQTLVLKEDFENTLDYVYQVLFKPTFPEDEFAKQKKQQLLRLANRSANVQTEIMDFFAKQLPADSAYSRTQLGTPEAVAALTPQDCKDFHAHYFVPENTVLAVFGDIDPDKTIAMLKEKFSGIPRSEKFMWQQFAAMTPRFDSTETKHLVNQKKNTAMVLVAYPTTSIYDEKVRGSLDMLGAVLTDGLGSRLYGELREEGLVYYVFGMSLTGFAPGYYVYIAQTRPETAGEVATRIQANLDRIRDEGIPQEEFEKAREKLLTSQAMRNTTSSEQAMQAGIDELYGLGYNYDAHFPERINKITSADVQQTVKEFFHNPLIVTSSPEAEPAKPAAN